MVRIQPLEEEFKKCPQLEVGDIKTIREWVKKQPHLPNIDAVPDLYLSTFLRRRHYRVELAKQTVDNALTFRTHTEELSRNRKLTSPQMLTCLNTHYITPMRHLDLEGNAVIFHVMRDNDVNKYDFNALIKRAFMIGDAWLLENGSANGISYVMDQKGFTASHMLRIPIAGAKKVIYFNKECSPVSLANIYIINANAVTNRFIAFFRSLMEDQLFKKMKVFPPSETNKLFEYIPKKCVPKEYGGTAGTLEELQDASIELMKRHQDFYEYTENLKVDESKRAGHQSNMNSVFGLDGSFKKLNID